MKTFTCVCGSRLFFENTTCVTCGRAVGFDAAARRLVPVAPRPDGTLVSETAPRGRAYRRCANHAGPVGCNWLVPASAPDGALCASCRLTETVPDLSRPEAVRLWAVVEEAKRQLLFTLLDLGLPVVGRADDPQHGLGFAFLEDRAANPSVAEERVITGHRQGLVTVNLVEADDVERERIRQALGERYRTLLGHLRHEAGHHYWRVLVEPTELLGGFRDLFGDERADYEAALAAHYARTDGPAWSDEFISAYAGAHPLEDWAETFAYYLHLTDTTQTAADFGIVDVDDPRDLEAVLPRWVELSVTLNALNRSMGLRDPLPFVLGDRVVAKLRFIHSAVERQRGERRAARGTSA